MIQQHASNPIPSRVDTHRRVVQFRNRVDTVGGELTL
jgi:hypothetical protein